MTIVKSLFAVSIFLLSAGLAKAGCNVEENLLHLQTIRTAVVIYYGDWDGRYPKTINELVPRYLYEMPTVTPCDDNGPHHEPSNAEHNFSSKSEANDSGGWGYINDPKSPELGEVFINCSHGSPQGPVWMKY